MAISTPIQVLRTDTRTTQPKFALRPQRAINREDLAAAGRSNSPQKADAHREHHASVEYLVAAS